MFGVNVRIVTPTVLKSNIFSFIFKHVQSKYCLLLIAFLS